MRSAPPAQATLFGALGILGFSLTLPATKLALTDLDPTFVGIGRALIAALLGGTALALTRSKPPVGKQWLRVLSIAAGVVIGFPLLSSWAMTSVPAAHGAVVIGLLPLSTAFFAAVFARERPRPLFWVSTIAGSATITVFSLATNSGSLESGDFLLLGAVLAAGFGYAQGALLTRELGSWQSISWALVVAAPVLAFPVYDSMPADISAVGWQSLAGFAYVSLISMFLAFAAWYQGLSLGGIARIGQLQLLQPFLTIAAAWLLLSEQVSWREGLAAAIVITCVLVGRRAAAVPRDPA